MFGVCCLGAKRLGTRPAGAKGSFLSIKKVIDYRLFCQWSVDLSFRIFFEKSSDFVQNTEQRIRTNKEE